MDETLTTEEIAKILKVHQRTVQRLIRSGELPAFRVGIQWRVNRSDLEAYRQTKPKQGNEEENLER
jgi:excisionase family DNA binding protein